MRAWQCARAGPCSNPRPLTPPWRIANRPISSTSSARPASTMPKAAPATTSRSSVMAASVRALDLQTLHRLVADRGALRHSAFRAHRHRDQRARRPLADPRHLRHRSRAGRRVPCRGGHRRDRRPGIATIADFAEARRVLADRIVISKADIAKDKAARALNPRADISRGAVQGRSAMDDGPAASRRLRRRGGPPPTIATPSSTPG